MSEARPRRPIGMPARLDELLRAAGWDTYVLAVEVGGRGVLHPELGWVSMAELRHVATLRAPEASDDD